MVIRLMMRVASHIFAGEADDTVPPVAADE